MPTYKLTYFDITGLGEFIRYLFSYGKIEFEERRLSQAEWAEIKPTKQWGKMPLLEIDGIEYHQSLAIGRYLAHIVGISGKDAMENFQIDMVLDTLFDFMKEVLIPFFVVDDNERNTKVKYVFENYLPQILPQFEKLAVENNGHLALSRVSLISILVIKKLTKF